MCVTLFGVVLGKLDFLDVDKWIRVERKRQRCRENTKEITMIDYHTSIPFDETTQTHRASLPKSNYNPNGIPMLGSYCENVCRALYLPLSPGKEI